jgi:phage tail sheath protein FI
MAETLVSPGVLATETDTSFVTQGPIQAGAAILGPTVKGPVNIPTLVTSYSDYQNKFGTTFVSGGSVYTYFTSIAAYNYFQNGGNTLLVSRIVSGTYAPATSTNILNTIPTSYTPGQFSTASFAFTGSNNGETFNLTPEVRFTGSLGGVTYTYRFLPTQSGAPSDETTGTTQVYFYASGSGITASLNNLSNKINAAGIGISTAVGTNNGDLIISSSASGSTYNGFVFRTGSGATFSTQATMGGGVDGTTVGNNISFVLKTISEGIEQNSSSSQDTNGVLTNGSKDNIRWQITTVNTSSGTFTLVIRQGNDNIQNQTILETWTNLSLDPFASNYIAKVVGDQVQTLKSDDGYYLQTTGSYQGSSRYVRVSSITNTPNYLDSNGNFNSTYTASLPIASSGSFTGATGTIMSNANYYELSTANNTQGVQASDYDNMINLLANKDDYQYNVILTPGLWNSAHSGRINSIISNVEGRGDSIYVVDPVAYGSTSTLVVTEAQTKNTSYAAMYWPWVQLVDPDSGQRVWVPASTVIGGVYAYTDQVSDPWFAPAGINRGGLSTVIQAERKLPQATRDVLYEGKVNPIATFPNQGVVVYGQKTLQTRPSALDRVNVRRLLIALKSYISQVANTLVFEQNSISTRNNFLAQVNPYLENVQQRQGLYAFKVIMDDSNNTADVIDRNQLIGQIYVQPTKTAEFIYLDFIVTPTGATFPG